MTKKNTNKSNTYKNGNYTGIYKGDNGNMLTATAMIYEVDGNEVITPIDISFVQLYAFLYDQYRSFQAQNKDCFEEWETVFKAMGRTYNTKKSKDQVKLLESCGLLKQIKMPSDNRRIKIVSDVSVKDIRFVNTEYDAYRAKQAANNATRQAEYAAFSAEKEEANKEAQGQQAKPVVSEPEVPKAPELKPVVKAEQPKAVELPKAEPKNDDLFVQLLNHGVPAENKTWPTLSEPQRQQVRLYVLSASNYMMAVHNFNQRVDKYAEVNRCAAQQQQEQPKAAEEKVSDYSWMAKLVPSAVTGKPRVTEPDDVDDPDWIPF